MVKHSLTIDAEGRWARQNVLNAAENAPKMSEANRRGHSSEARSEKGEPGVCERPRQNAGHRADARGTRPMRVGRAVRSPSRPRQNAGGLRQRKISAAEGEKKKFKICEFSICIFGLKYGII